MVTVHEDQCTFMIIFHWILLRKIQVSDKIFGENQNTHFMFNDYPPPQSCCVWDKVEESCRTGEATVGNITWCMHVACLITKAIDAHSKCVILFTFPQ